MFSTAIPGLLIPVPDDSIAAHDPIQLAIAAAQSPMFDDSDFRRIAAEFRSRPERVATNPVAKLFNRVHSMAENAQGHPRVEQYKHLAVLIGRLGVLKGHFHQRIGKDDAEYDPINNYFKSIFNSIGNMIGEMSAGAQNN